MLNKELWTKRRAAWAATVLLAVGQAACMEPPMPAEMPPQPAEPPAYPQAPAQYPDPGVPQPEAQAPQQGDDDAKTDDFYEPLAQYGTWVDTPEYGRVWQPASDVAGDDFTPYASDGEWAANDEGDWVFQSRWDKEWGWATYHYGRWAFRDDYGWVWVPGTVWAPSWVEWRYGGGYVGWVPLGPPGYVVADTRWIFVEERWMGSPGIYTYRLGPDRWRMAYSVAYPVGMSRYGRWYAGPPVARVRASGVVVRTVHTVPPRRGQVRSYAAAVTRNAAPYRAGRPAHQPRVRNGYQPPAHQPQHHSAPPQHHSAPPQHHSAPPSHHSAPPSHHSAPPSHHSAPPSHHSAPPSHHSAPPSHHSAPPPQHHSAPPKPKPTPAPAPAKHGKKR